MNEERANHKRKRDTEVEDYRTDDNKENEPMREIVLSDASRL
jgi:hypothetical protein